MSGPAISANPNTERHDSDADAQRPAILQVIPRLDTGGAERSAIDVAAALARAGFTALVASEGGRMVAELERAGGEWIFAPLDTKAPHRLLANALRLRDLIVRRNVKLIHARSRAPAWSSLWAARRARIPLVTTWHGAYGGTPAIKRFYNSVMARGDAVIANSQWTADHIRTQYGLAPKRLAVIPRGIDFARFDPAQVSPERVHTLRAAWGARDGEFVVLLPGRLTRWKGQHVLIAAMAEIVRSGSASVRAVLAGDAQGRDAYVGELKRLIAGSGLEDRVVIAGHVADMAAAYLAADVVVSASIEEEAFGRTTAEASAMARPVIATDHGGARETVLAGESGFLVPPGNAQALAASLTGMMTLSAEERAQMGGRGRAHVAAHFTVARMCADTIAVYRALMGG